MIAAELSFSLFTTVYYLMILTPFLYFLNLSN